MYVDTLEVIGQQTTLQKFCGSLPEVLQQELSAPNNDGDGGDACPALFSLSRAGTYDHLLRGEIPVTGRCAHLFSRFLTRFCCSIYSARDNRQGGQTFILSEYVIPGPYSTWPSNVQALHTSQQNQISATNKTHTQGSMCRLPAFVDPIHGRVALLYRLRTYYFAQLTRPVRWPSRREPEGSIARILILNE